ncbi:MAG: ligase-associated DNA damage response endonuclease PdeM [Rhodobacteraceae bacterium]|nr:ligase-associated DNA damage response endonuclease PdeM [Paracoccaceae bacterium]
MRTYDFTLADARLTALSSGALWWSEAGILCVSDLHFGKSGRLARRAGNMLPPYENRETLERLEADILTRNPETIICLGDSFDDLYAFEEMDEADRLWLTCLMAGRQWVWIEGNHDPGPVDIGGTHLAQFRAGPLVFRHIADPDASGEVSGHFHPKAGLRGIRRPCFLLDGRRLILPAYGTYTGGLRSDTGVLSELMGKDAIAILTGNNVQPMPMPR